jgi:hypothetical protein
MVDADGPARVGSIAMWLNNRKVYQRDPMMLIVIGEKASTVF